MTIQPMNRAQRRAARRKHAPSKTRASSPLTPLYILDNARPHDPDEKAGAHLKTLSRFDLLRDGEADQADFDHVAMTLNICKVRALEIDATLASAIERAQEAMQLCSDRRESDGRYNLDAPGLELVAYALGVAQAIIDASTPLQMRSARRAVVDAMFGKGAWRRMERMVAA